MLERARLLVGHGVDFRSPLTAGVAAGRTPLELARLCGYPRIAGYLSAEGAAEAEFGPVDEFVAAALMADRVAAARLAGADPTVIDAVRARHPALIMRAAVAKRLDAVRLLAELGFDVNALGRQDAPVDQPWETPLHHAASVGDVGLAGLLISLGADPDLRDRRYDSTPLGWARYFEQPATVELLEPVTSDLEPGE
jgi:hypothetical protein